MLSLLYDPMNTTLLTSVSGVVTDQEWQSMYDALLRIMQDSRQRRTPTLIVSFSDPNTSRPNANWRKRFAETRTMSDKTLPSFLVLVTSSMMLRGVMIALNWVTPKSALEENYATDNFEEGLAWLQKKTGQSLPHIRQMYKEIMSTASVGAV